MTARPHSSSKSHQSAATAPPSFGPGQPRSDRALAPAASPDQPACSSHRGGRPLDTPRRARCVPVGPGNPGEQRTVTAIGAGGVSSKNAGQPACTRSLLSGRSSVGRGTSGAHQREICPEALRTAEISSAGQTACRADRSRLKTPWHKTRPTDRLDCAGKLGHSCT